MPIATPEVVGLDGARRVDPTPAQIERFREFILEAEQSGLRDAPGRNRPLVERALNDSVDAHVAAFEDVFPISAGIALLGALACVVVVRKTDRTLACSSAVARAGSTRTWA